MSGGSYDYKYYIIDEYYTGRMFDLELDEMMKDLVKVLHDVEWWQSGDIDEKDYRKTVDKFKKKWFKRSRVDIETFIDGVFKEQKQELKKCLKYLE